MTTVSASNRRLAPPRAPRPREASDRSEAGAGTVAPPQRYELDTVASCWQRALDAAQRALSAAEGTLPAVELETGRRELAQERLETAAGLVRLAHVSGIQPAPWLSTVPVTATMLGLPLTVRACLFDLDGVLTDSALLHAAAWSEVLDEFLLRLSERAGWQFIPFDPLADYRSYLDGRPRIEGIHVFLSSRGLRVPEGRPTDSVRDDTAYGLACRKSNALERLLTRRGVTSLTAARRYLEAAGHAGLWRIVVSASTRAVPMLELARLSTLVDGQVDADVMRNEGLRSRPAPDLLLAACRRVDVRPTDAVTFTSNPAGIAAGRAAGLTVIGVGAEAHADVLRGFGAERVIPSLGVLLDPRLAATP